ncbi:D-alanyl-D-alanine carboxypeptidase [Streptomyces sp. ATMOS53]
MAGESPDRSKQRESSAEPTSGSAGAVPDPRVAASTPRGGVDTATRVFSVRDLKTETPEEPASAETPDETGSADKPGTPRSADEPGEAGNPAAASVTAETAAGEAGKATETADTGKPAKVGAPRTAARTGETETDVEDGDGDEVEVGVEVEVKNAGSDAAETGSTDKATVAGQAAETPEGANPAKADPRRTVGATGKPEAAEELGESEDQTAESTSKTTEAKETAETEQASQVGKSAVPTATTEEAQAGEAGTAEEAAKPAKADATGRAGEADATGKSAEAGADVADREAAGAGTDVADREAAGAGTDVAGRVAVAGASEGVGGAPGGSKGVEEGPGGSGALGGGDERLRAAVAQWVASADEKGPAEDSADAVGGAKERSESDAGAAEAQPGDKSAPKPVSKSAPKWAADEDEDEGDEPKSDKAESDKVQSGKDESRNDESDSDGSGKGASDSDESGKSAPDSDESGKSAPDSDRAGMGASDSDRAGSDGSDKGASDSDDESGKGASGKAGGGGGGSGVDQPTAVFKAPRPKPAVDQPTTMLKLGGATKPKPDADEADKADAEPEADAPAERTSKFVALKPLDEPRPLKPAAKASPEVTALVPQIGPERTTQQPLPPKPPLDLLAELTNTPPPPPTPLRTLGRRIKIWTPLVLLLVVVFAIAQAVRPLPATALALTAKDSYTFEGGKTQLPFPGEGQGWIDVDGVGTMGSFGQPKPVAIGSVAKTMTAYIILKDHPMKAGEEGPKIEIDATAEKEGGYDVTGDESTLNTVKAGDFLTEKQALSAVLIPSANNIARLLARWDAGSEAAFVKKMNATAKELGMTRTTYTDPSGLKETTVSTAEDQVKLGRAFVQVPALVAISSAASWTDPSGKYWNNYNELPFRIGAIGIKTGSTTAAGGNLLFASRKQVNGRSVTLVGAILGQHKQKILETVNAVSKTALLAAQDALTSAKIVKKGDVVGYVDDKLGHHTPVVVTKDVSAVGWAGMTVKLSFVADEVPHTAKAGAQVGTLTVGDGSGSAVKVPVALQTDLVEPGFTDKLTRIG